MCYDYTMHAEQAELDKEFKRKMADDVKVSYHADGFTNPSMPVIANDKPNDIQLSEWGLLPSWAKDAEEFRSKTNTLNARADSIFTLSSYKAVAQNNHCLIITTGFYEPHHLPSGAVIYYYIHTKSSNLFTFGGLWSDWKDPANGQVKHTFTMLTVPSTPAFSKIHNTKPRMPFIVPKEARELWLSHDLSKADIGELMQPYPDDDLEYWPCKFSKKRNVDHNTPESIKPIQISIQSSLF